MADALPSPFTEWFRPLLEAWVAAIKGRSQASFGRAVGLGPASMTRILRGEEGVSPRRLADICREFGLSGADARVPYELCGVDLGPVMDAPEQEPAEAERLAE